MKHFILAFSCLILSGCASISNGLASHTYWDPGLKVKDVRGKQVAFFKLSPAAVHVGPTLDESAMASYIPYNKEEFLQNEALMRATAAWADSFSTAFTRQALRRASEVKGKIVDAGAPSFEENEIKHFTYEISGNPYDFTVPTRDALKSRGLDPDFGLYLSRATISRESIFPSENGQMIINRKSVKLTVRIEYVLWNYREDKLAGCGSVQETEYQHHRYPTTRPLGKSSADRIVSALVYLVPPITTTGTGTYP